MTHLKRSKYFGVLLFLIVNLCILKQCIFFGIFFNFEKIKLHTELFVWSFSYNKSLVSSEMQKLISAQSADPYINPDLTQSTPSNFSCSLSPTNLFRCVQSCTVSTFRLRNENLYELLLPSTCYNIFPSYSPFF